MLVSNVPRSDGETYEKAHCERVLATAMLSAQAGGICGEVQTFSYVRAIYFGNGGRILLNIPTYSHFGHLD